MQISVESTGKLEREMKVAIPEERINSEVQNRLTRLSRTTKVDGFRPGKVPFRIIQQRFGKQVRQEVVGEVVQSTFYEALGQEKLNPAGRPEIDSLEAEQGQGLEYTARFEVYPDVELQPVEKLTVEKTVCEIGEADIDTMIEVLRKQRKDLKEVERPARKGETVEIDFEGFVDGAVFEGGKGENYPLELGGGRFIEGFEDGLVGRKAGEEVVLDLTFPAEYHQAELAGKPVQFRIQVKKVQEDVLPELDEAFFAGFGITEGGEQAFREELRSHMQREAETQVRNRCREAVMEALLQANDIDLPKSLIHEEAHRLQHQFQQQMRSYGMTDTDKLPSDLSLFEEQARRRVAIQLIVLEIIRARDMKADPGKVREMIEKNAANYEDSAAIVNWYYSDEKRLADIEGLVLEDQVLDWVLQNARVSEVQATFDELVNKGQTGAA